MIHKHLGIKTIDEEDADFYIYFLTRIRIFTKKTLIYPVAPRKSSSQSISLKKNCVKIYYVVILCKCPTNR